LCESHDHLFVGNNAAQKTYIKLTTSYFWPNVYSHVLKHTQTCLRCQQRKTSRAKQPPLAPLPIPDQPNIRIHADLFGPMVNAEHKNAYILCITDAFTKYAVVAKIDSKEAETVARAIFDNWFCKFGIPAQIHTDGGKEFVNKLSAELFELLNVQHSKTSPYHPQCNAQVEVFNKTVKKYLASYVDESTLNWQDFLPALMLAYNTSYHSTIATTPFELLFGVKPRLPSLPAPEIERAHYGESFAAERLQILQHARKMAQETATEQGNKYKFNYDAKAQPHKFKIGQKIFLNDSTSLGKNSKLSPNWTGPYEIIDLNDNNAKIKLKNKLKVVNIARIKPFVEEPKPRLFQDDSSPSQDSPNGLDQGQLTGFPKRPMTRAFKKLQELKNAATLAIAILQEEKDAECNGNPFTNNFDKYHCTNCYNGIKSFLKLPNLKQIFQDASKTFQFENVIDQNSSAPQNSKQDQENLINFTKDTDPQPLATIKEELHQPLLSVASKLLCNQHLTLDQLSTEEQILWNTFSNEDIYEFLTGKRTLYQNFSLTGLSLIPNCAGPLTGKTLFCLNPNINRLKLHLSQSSNKSSSSQLQFRFQLHQRFLNNLGFHEQRLLLSSLTEFCVINNLLITKSCILVLRENAKH
jgi:transposase InsO family protein